MQLGGGTVYQRGYAILLGTAQDGGVPLIHLNHSNPLQGSGPERDWLAARGIRIGTFGARWRLD